MDQKEKLRNMVNQGLVDILGLLNRSLRGEGVKRYKDVLSRLGRGGKLPHWYGQLEAKGTLPNLDGKTVGSVVEMLFVAVLEKEVFKNAGIPPLRVNPARGIDLPDLDLGVKSPSTNYCTSEPFFSAYERLIGSEFDAVIFLTDYQTTKTRPPLRLSILDGKYLSKTQIADEGLCALGRQFRDEMLKENEAWTRKFFRFLAFVNQSDWRGKILLGILKKFDDEKSIQNLVVAAKKSFDAANKRRLSKDQEPLQDEELLAIQKIATVRPVRVGVMDGIDNWVVENWKDFGRFPNDNEWNRLLKGPLDGQIGMSFALQWRYNFGRIFSKEQGRSKHKK